MSKPEKKYNYDVFSLDGKWLGTIVDSQLAIAAKKARIYWPCVITAEHMPGTEAMISEQGLVESYTGTKKKSVAEEEIPV